MGLHKFDASREFREKNSGLGVSQHQKVKIGTARVLVFERSRTPAASRWKLNLECEQVVDASFQIECSEGALLLRCANTENHFKLD